MHKVLHLFFTETYRRDIKAVTEAIRKGNKKYTKQVTGWWIVKAGCAAYNFSNSRGGDCIISV